MVVSHSIGRLRVALGLRGSGAERAERFALDRGVAACRAAQIGAAIAGHITVGAADNLGDPAGPSRPGHSSTSPACPRTSYTQDGSTRSSGITRLGIRQHLPSAFEAEAAAVPDGRIHWISAVRRIRAARASGGPVRRIAVPASSRLPRKGRPHGTGPKSHIYYLTP